jgi:hypothetical protein
MVMGVGFQLKKNFVGIDKNANIRLVEISLKNTITAVYGAIGSYM